MYNKNVRYESDYDLIESNLMSIIIGVKCKDCAIIGSDSQVSNLETNTKKLDEKKIFKDETDDKKIKFIYGFIGDVFFKEILLNNIKSIYNKQYSKNNEIQNTEQFGEICKQAMEMINIHYEFQKKLEKNELLCFRTLIGVVIKDQHELFAIRPNGIVERTLDYYPIGSKSEIAEIFIIKMRQAFGNSFDVLDDKNKTLKSILYFIYQLKQYDLYCGGETQYKILNKNGEIEETDKSFIDIFESSIPELEKKYNYFWSSLIGYEKNK